MKGDDGTSSCTGITYFTTAMKTSGRPPLCIGRRGSIPSDLAQKEVIERSARTDQNFDFTYTCVGYSQTTPKMEREGSLPLCDVGMRFTALRAPKLEQQPQQIPVTPMRTVWGRVFSSVTAFWRKAFDDFPNKWYNFNQKLYANMHKQAQFLFKLLNKLSQEALQWWLSRP